MAVTPTLTALQVMQDAPVIPVIVLHDVAHAVPMARALVAGGVRMLEVTLRTPVALACMEAIARDVPEAVVGAGTVRSAADAQAARWPVPGLPSARATPAIGQACRDLGLPLLPGVATGSEILMCQEDGLTELKFFPALQAGGSGRCSRPGLARFGDPWFLPDRRHQPGERAEFLALPNVACVGGSWLVPADALAQGDWARITQLARFAAASGPSPGSSCRSSSSCSAPRARVAGAAVPAQRWRRPTGRCTAGSRLSSRGLLGQGGVHEGGSGATFRGIGGQAGDNACPVGG
jgi:2-dehydro-3-deoxyphosphogluconate aldolase/(4S)-4-hydroxy-2-oxoglutarate aldolase